MKVLVTGDRGYLGSVLVPMLRRAGHDVLGVDSGWRDVPPAKRSPYPYEQRDGDVRDLSADDLADVGAVVHLAGMAATPEDDWAASVVQTQLVDMARAVATAAAGAGVERLVMVSSRDVYRGRPATTTTGAPLLDRSSPSASARISAEDAFRLAASPTAGVAVLRLATLYGASPRLRLDDELNRAVVSALVDGAVAIDHDGSRLRAFLHVKDACRTIMHALVRLGQTSTGSDTIDVGRLEDVLTLRDALELVSIITGAPRDVRCRAGPRRRRSRRPGPALSGVARSRAPLDPRARDPRPVPRPHDEPCGCAVGAAGRGGTRSPRGRHRRRGGGPRRRPHPASRDRAAAPPRVK